MRIESLQNPRVKRVLLLQQKARERQKQKLFVVEGSREVARALKSGFELEELWSISDNVISSFKISEKQFISCSSAVFSKITYREHAAEVVAVFKTKTLALSNLILPKNPLLVILEGIEKPGNIGAVLRTCNGLKVDAVIVCDSKVDLFNPNIIRNSLGGFFDTQIAATSSVEAIEYLNEKNISIAATYLKASKNYLDVDYTKSKAIVFGSEANGISDIWVKNTSERIIIEMNGIVDSLNISVATAIVASEAIRQRRNKKAPEKIRGLTPNQ